jgi:hypothetical protein
MGKSVKTLMNAYLTSFRLALKRDPTSDTFVLKKSISYLKKAIVAIGGIEPGILETMLEELDAFLSSERHLALQLEVLFVDSKQSSIYNSNIRALSEFRKELAELVGTKKGGPEASKESEPDGSSDGVLEDETSATLSVLTHADELEATLDKDVSGEHSALDVEALRSGDGITTQSVGVGEGGVAVVGVQGGHEAVGGG